MNKLTKLLSVFILAGAVGASVAGVAGCNKGGNDGHTHNYSWVNDNNGKCHEHCGVAGCDTPDKPSQNHVDANSDGKCDNCQASISSELTVPANVTGILIEGVTSGTIELSETKKSHTIDKSAIKVYFATGNNADVKGDEVPAANVVLELKDNSGVAVSSWENITKDGVYKVNASLKDAVMASGATATIDDLKATVTVTISNPVVDNSLKKTSTGDTVFMQGETVSKPDWTFEVTLANGDKQAVPAKDITITGIDTLMAGNKQATITYGTQTLKVDYEVTENTNIRVQSYAVNANTLALGSNTSNVVLNETGKISITAKSGKTVDIDANSKSIDGKSFVQRIKLGGSPIKGGALDGDVVFRTIKIEDVNKTTAEGATSKTLITVYAASSSEASPRNLTIYKEGVTTESKPTLTKVENATNAFGAIAKYVYEINDTGTFHIASESGGINIYYLQVDKIMTGETGAENIPLGGELKAISLSLDTAAAKTVYKVGETIDTSAVTGSVTLANSVTADSETRSIANGDLKFDTSLFDSNNLGEYAITVTYGEGAAAVTKTYNVTVESAIDGVKGATASLKSGLITEVETADAKLTFKKSDVVVSPVWTSAEVAGITTAYTVKYNGTEINDTTGYEFGVGTYTLTVEITVSGATGTTATFTKEITLEVTKKAAEGEFANVKMTVNDEIANMVGSAATTEAKVLAEGITLGLANKSGSSAATINGVDYSKYVQIAGSFKPADKDTKSIKLEVKGAATIKVICKSSAAERILNLYNSEGVKVVGGSDSTAGVELSFSVSAAGIYYLGSASSSINIYQIEIVYNA